MYNLCSFLVSDNAFSKCACEHFRKSLKSLIVHWYTCSIDMQADDDGPKLAKIRTYTVHLRHESGAL